MKKSSSSPEQQPERDADLEYYELGSSSIADTEHDRFFDTLNQEEEEQNEKFSDQPPVRLDKFYQKKSKKNDT